MNLLFRGALAPRDRHCETSLMKQYPSAMRKRPSKRRAVLRQAHDPPKTSNKLSFAALAVSILALSISGSQALIALKTMNRSFEASVLQHRIAECSKTIAAIQAAAVLDAEIRVS